MTEHLFGFLRVENVHPWSTFDPNGEHLFDPGPWGLDCSPVQPPYGPPSTWDG